MTDREKLIKVLRGAVKEACYFCGETICKKCKYEKYALDCKYAARADYLIANGVVISNSETTTMQQWIPVTERLPEHPEYDWVLVQVKMNPEDYYGVPHIAELRNGVWYDEDDLPLEEFRSVKVTHWMPLPQPPKGE